MRKWLRSANLAAIISTLVSVGCATAAPAPSTTPANPFAAISDGEVTALETTTGAETASVATHEVDLSGLPVAPWSVAPLATTAVPGAVLSAWATAENRTVCAPVALATAGEARARVSDMIEGGWAVEFDRPGMPGLSANGESCARCGRGTFGIAGTAMSPSEIAGEEVGDAPAPSFADGSHLEVEPPAEGEDVAAAMITMSGQGCVYQVWSFLGEAHVRELVAGLRRIDVAPEQPLAAR